jgi:hypothetical protein
MWLLRAGAMGRAQLLCDKHRNQQLHDCARANAMLARHRTKSAGEIAAEVAARAGPPRRVACDHNES